MKMLSYAHGGADDLGKWTEKKKTSEGKPNWPVFERTYRALGFLLLLAALPATLFSVFTGWWSLGSLTGFSYERTWLWAGMALGVLTPAVNLYFSRPAVALQAIGQISVQNRTVVLGNLLSVVASVVVVLVGGRLFSVMLCQLIFSWFSRALLLWRLPDKIKSYALSNSWDAEVFRWAKEPLWKGGLTVIAGMGVHRSAGIFLASTGIPGFAAPFLFAQSILTTLQMIASAPLNSQIPRYSRMLAEGRRYEIIQDSFPRILFVAFVLIVFTIAMAFGLPIFLDLVDSSIGSLPFLLIILLGFLRAIYCLQLGFNSIQNLTNDILVTNRFLIAVPISLLFFVVGMIEKEYLWFVVGVYLPLIFLLNWTTFQMFLRVGDLKKSDLKFDISRFRKRKSPTI
jgi:hypothetical protein